MAKKALKIAKAEKEKNEKESDRANIQKKWDEGKMVECLMLIFKVHQGNHHNNEWIHHRVKVE